VPVLEALAAGNILGGYDLSADYPELGNGLLICATETKTDADLRHYALALNEIMMAQQAKSA
jgi:glycine dehydrogenase subunit 1